MTCRLSHCQMRNVMTKAYHDESSAGEATAFPAAHEAFALRYERYN